MGACNKLSGTQDQEISQEADSELVTLQARKGINESLYQVTSSYFTAGFVVKDGLIVETAPILRKHVKGMRLLGAREYVYKRGWKIQKVK